MAVISNGIYLSYKSTSSPTFTGLSDLLEIPELGGDVDSIEITTLADDFHKYAPGIKNYGDAIQFKFLYQNEQFMKLVNLAEEEQEWQLELPDGACCKFNGYPSVKLDGVGISAALTYTLSIRPCSTMYWSRVEE